MTQINPATIIGWLREAAPNWPVPATTAPEVIALVAEINWVGRKTRTSYPREKAKRDARDAALQTELWEAIRPIPRLVSEMRERGIIVADEIDWSMALQRAAENLLDCGLLGPKRRPNKRWHSAANLIARRVMLVWSAVGVKASHQTEEGPLAHFVALALEHIFDGQDVPSHTAIAKALQRARRRAA
jgi:hypothetical protein